MNQKLDIALTKKLKELLGNSGKRIAVYFKEGAAWPQVLTVYQNETPPTKHPNHSDFSFSGWANLNTGEVVPDLEVDAGVDPDYRARITWRMVALALLGLFIYLGKLMMWCVIGLVMIVAAFTRAGGHSRGRSRSRIR